MALSVNVYGTSVPPGKSDSTAPPFSDNLLPSRNASWISFQAHFVPVSGAAEAEGAGAASGAAPSTAGAGAASGAGATSGAGTASGAGAASSASRSGRAEPAGAAAPPASPAGSGALQPAITVIITRLNRLKRILLIYLPFPFFAEFVHTDPIREAKSYHVGRRIPSCCPPCI